MNESEARLDQVLEALAMLATHEPDAGRAAEVRARCHSVLKKRARRLRVAPPSPGTGWRRALEPAIVGSLCAVYLYEVLSRARELYRF